MSRRARAAVALVALLHGAWLLSLSLARYAALRNHTFDLAFYARIAWGLVHGHTWEPMVGAHVFGLHLSPILLPLGALGAVFGTVPVLLVAQSSAVAATAFPLARLGARRAGDVGALTAAALFALSPNLGPVAAEAFHPGTVAVLPLAWAIDALDRRDARGLAWAVAGVLACREDLALVTIALALLFDDRRVGRRIAIASAAWLGLYLAVLLPIFGPRGGSLHLHFGALWHDPGSFLAHLFSSERLLYLPKVLALFALLPLFAPRWLLVATPILAVNLLSMFPTTTEIGSHYLTPAIPVLVAAAIDGAIRIGKRTSLPVLAAFAVAVFAVLGPTPRDRTDARTLDARRVLARIPPAESVQGPGWLLAHVAERDLVFRGPPPDREATWVVLDVSHRRARAGAERLLRTKEEPIVRRWLARDDHAIELARGDLLLLHRGVHPREGIGGRAIVGRAIPQEGTPVASCLSVLGAKAHDGVVDVDFVARGPCPGDVALRIGEEWKPRRVDLLFDGLLSPVHLRAGDRVRSRHVVDVRDGLRVGLLRSGGARIDPADPMTVEVPVE